MSLSYFFDQLLAGGGEFSHGDPLMFLPTPGYINRSAACSVPDGAIQRGKRKLGNVAGKQFRAIAASNFEVFASHVDRTCGQASRSR
jgi:hypothetical protein